MTKVIEQFTRSKTGIEADNEDRIFVSDAFIGVVDGATSKSDRRFDGKTGGQAVASAIIERLGEISSSISAEGAVTFLSSAIFESIIAPNFGRRFVSGDRPNASLVIFSVERREIWRVGDCHFAIDGVVNYGSKQIDAITSAFRAAYNKTLLLQGKTIADLKAKDVGRDKILPLLKRQGTLMNNPDAGSLGYGVIDGNPAALKFLQIFPVQSAAEIVLFSDGYPSIGKDLRESEERLFDLVRGDPLLIDRCKQTKGLAGTNQTYDDRAYVRFTSN